MRLLRALQDLPERRLGGRRRPTAQHVVGAEFDQQRVGPCRHAPVVAREPVRGRFTRNAGVGHLHVPPLGLQGAREDLGKPLAGRKAEARGQAVAERDDAQRSPGRGRREQREREGQRRGRLDAERKMTI